MSYEGYVQAICAKGHQRAWDAFYHGLERCQCGADIVFTNEVDQTNGCYENSEKPGTCVCGKIEFDIKEPQQTHTCSCGNVHVVKEATYKPTGKITSHHKALSVPESEK